MQRFKEDTPCCRPPRRRVVPSGHCCACGKPQQSHRQSHSHTACLWSSSSGIPTATNHSSAPCTSKPSPGRQGLMLQLSQPALSLSSGVVSCSCSWLHALDSSDQGPYRVAFVSQGSCAVYATLPATRGAAAEPCSSPSMASSSSEPWPTPLTTTREEIQGGVRDPGVLRGVRNTACDAWRC